MYVYIYVCIYIYVYVSIYIYDIYTYIRISGLIVFDQKLYPSAIKPCQGTVIGDI